MARFPEETITIPVSMLPPFMLDEARSYERYAESRSKYEAEDRLRDGTASEPEKIKAAWAQYGRGKAWPQEHGYQISIPEAYFAEPIECYATTPLPEKRRTYQFHREVTRNKNFTVTRIHCGGLTVEETIS